MKQGSVDELTSAATDALASAPTLWDSLLATIKVPSCLEGDS